MGDALVRANYARSIKRIYEYTTAENFTSATLEDVQVRLNRLESLWRQFDTGNERVLLNLTSEDENDDLYELTNKLKTSTSKRRSP